jgi:ABC-type Fe3+-hydroxamate transport system substrate-binding protein
MSTYVDALNRSIALETPPSRIVSLVPSITEALFTFGLRDSIAGVTQFCSEPRVEVATKPKVGGTKTLDVRSVLNLEPDLVIANAEENRQEDIRQLLAAGQRVFVTFPRTVPGAISMLRQISQMTGTAETAAPYLDDAEQALASVKAANAHRAKLRVFCPIWRRPWMTVGSNTYMHDFIASCGGYNIFSERHERYPKAELDDVARRAPQVIMLPDEPYPFSAKHIPELQEYRYVPAVRDNRIYMLEGKHLCWYGPRIARSLLYVQKLLWGEEPVAAPE